MVFLRELQTYRYTGYFYISEPNNFSDKLMNMPTSQTVIDPWRLNNQILSEQ